MTQENIIRQLDDMLDNPKAKKFLSHLIRAYFPLSNGVKVLDKPRDVEFKCLITRIPLYSINDIYQGINDEKFKTSVGEYLDKMFDEKTDKTSPIAKLISERSLGVTGSNTTTFMSYEAFQMFQIWVMNKILLGDKHINFLVKTMKGQGQDVSHFNTGKSETSKSNTGKAATFALGDMDVFQKLKAKLDLN